MSYYATDYGKSANKVLEIIMDKEKEYKWEHKNWKHGHHGGGGGAFYVLGLIGALIYYLQHTSTFTDGLIGILKAIAWPAFLIHKIFTLLGM